MAEETITILKVGTEEAVKSVNDLKDNIKLLKGNLGELEIGTTEYKNTLDELKVNQNALRDAMYATTASMTEVAAAATGASKSYNSLVHQMAALKEEWRATNDEARRNELGKQISEINQQLKDMDASVGNFQRNVGNYESGVSGLVAKFDSWGETLKIMPPTLGAAKDKMSQVGETMQLIGKQPILGIVGLLAPIIMKIVEALRENETAMGAVKKLMDAMQPVFNVFSQVLEKVAQGFSDLVDWVVQLVGKNGGFFGKIVESVTGVGNALLQYLLVPIRNVISAFQGLGNIMKDVFTGQWGKIKEDAQAAWADIKSNFEEGFSFKNNYEQGQKLGADFVEGIKSNKEAAKAAGAELTKAMEEGENTALFNEEEDEAAAIADEEAFNAEMEAMAQREKAKTDALWQGLHDRFDAKEEALQQEADLEKAVADETTAYLEEQNEKRKESDRQRTENTIATLNAAASATSGILNGIADMYEADAQNSKKNAKKAKALRVAAATIDMLQGAVTAFASAMQLGPIAGPIVGAVNAAAVVAMGIANISKIKSANMDSESGTSTAVTAPTAPSFSASIAEAKQEAKQEAKMAEDVGAVVDAPNIDTGMQTVRSATSASEEERLNRMASSQRVYILQSDIEASNNMSKTIVSEATF